MFVVHDTELDLWLSQSQWVPERDIADQFADGDTARKLAQTFTRAFCRTIEAVDIGPPEEGA